ncbi:hypothetical protein QWZ10_11465 [Paracoccus cavernae]|uniref:Uncharacterized protein n=1 Tax=Paracoccus cavernae TaxID=1571207 RepID=A0ABT8D627_9RHOB|nr:hypothetical protein [Paracoccus cavernae]
MRHFFITSFERLMNVMVVLTGLAILALAGKMAMDAKGIPSSCFTRRLSSWAASSC